MKDELTLKHEFVEFIPSKLKEHTIYISMRFGTASHLCCCGCGNTVVTPIRPTDWTLTFDGKTISLDPSIGNWSFECQSHYWIKNNRVIRAERWSKNRISAVRTRDRFVKDRYFGAASKPKDDMSKSVPRAAETHGSKQSMWQKVKKWWEGLR